MTIVWFSRHRPTLRQQKKLRELFGDDVRVRRDKRPFDGAADIVARFRRIKADEMVVVAPLTVIRALLSAGLRPITAEMRPCQRTHPDAEVHIRGHGGSVRHYRFIKFSRISAITLTLEEIAPPNTAPLQGKEEQKQ